MITTEAGWRADGAPWKLARPIFEIRRSLVIIYGEAAVKESVGTIGNPAHLSARVPQDHCPYSQTGWPVLSPYPYVHALDDSLPNFQRRFRYWIVEKRAGRAPWVKYINLLGWHHAWQPLEQRTTSSDDPYHGHLSIRSDWTTRSIADGWNTLRRGTANAQVKSLQTMLNAHGAGLTVDSVFGPKTEAAVKTLQTARHITVDGIAGPRTRVELAVL